MNTTEHVIERIAFLDSAEKEFLLHVDGITAERDGLLQVKAWLEEDARQEAQKEAQKEAQEESYE